MSARGFIAGLFWPAVVLLNLLLLAQVMELFFPGGDRIVLGTFGTYSAFALVAGALFSSSQSLFGLVVGESETEGFVSRDEGGAAGGEDGHAVQRAGLFVAEERGAGGEVTEDDLGHAVVQFGGECLVLGSGEWRKGKTGGGSAEVDSEAAVLRFFCFV